MPRQHLTAVIGADTRGFNSAMGKLGGTVAKVGVALGAIGAAAAAGLAKATKKAIDYGDQIDKASKRTGIAAEQLQRYQLAADLSGASLADLEKATKRSASVILDAQNGLAESKRALDDLGLSADDLADKTPEQQLDAFLQGLAGVENASKRAALAQDIFGRAGTNLLPIIDGGVDAYRELLGEADKLGAVLSQDQVTAAAEAKDAITRLQAALNGLAFGAILSDGMSVADMFNEMAQEVAAFSESGGLRDLSDTFRSLVDVLKVVYVFLRGIVTAMAKVGQFSENLFSAAGITQGGRAFSQLSAGRGEFGAATTADLVLARLDMMMRDGLPVTPAKAGI